MKIIYRALLILFLFVPLSPAQNYSLNFDGNSYVTVLHSDTLNLANHLTIECWFTVQGASINDWIGIVCKVDASSVNYSGYFFGLGQSSTYPNWIVFYIYPSGQHINCPFSPTLNQWYNLAITYNGSVMKMFLDGNLIQEQVANEQIASNTFPLTIGGQNGNFWNRNLNGKIDEVRISSIARYDTNFTPITYFDYDANTIALYHFNEGVGDTVFDSSGNNNNGTIYGAVWSGDVPGLTGVQGKGIMNSDKFEIYQNYPNPFNPTTTIKYSVPHPVRVVIKVYGILGNEIAILLNEEKHAGTYELTWNASNIPSGVYFYELSAAPVGGQAGSYIETRKMVLLK